MADLVAYVDGFNLYHGMHAKYGHTYLWLDLFALVQAMRVQDRVIGVNYFTAIVKGEPEAARRQETYLAALAAYRPQVKVTRGEFQKKRLKCTACGTRWQCQCSPPREYRTYEEKMTDVAIAAAMVTDAARGRGQLAMLISTDTDFRPAIEACLTLAPSRQVIIACPPGRVGPKHDHNGQVLAFPIPEKHLAASQLPDQVQGLTRVYTRPAKWQ